MPDFSRRRALALAAVIVVLLATPAPLVPPHRLSALIQSLLGVGWKPAFLLAALLTQTAFYGTLGLAAAFTVGEKASRGARWLQFVTVPAVIIGAALLARSLKVGHPPVLSSAAVPAAACLGGAWLGLGVLYRRGAAAALGVSLALGLAAWSLLGSAPTALAQATRDRLHHVVSAGPRLPEGEARFGALLRASFDRTSLPAGAEFDAEASRAAILAWGIVLGHEQLARFLGMDPEGDLIRQAIALRRGTRLRGRDDWARHYALSAALAVLEHPLVSDAAGLLKEQLDAHSGGSGFSFGDLAADRAGVRFAGAATRSDAAAAAMRHRLERGFSTDDFFPPVADLPEDLSVEEFRRRFGVVGSERYRDIVTRIDRRLDRCAALQGH